MTIDDIDREIADLFEGTGRNLVYGAFSLPRDLPVMSPDQIADAADSAIAVYLKAIERTEAEINMLRRVIAMDERLKELAHLKRSLMAH